MEGVKRYGLMVYMALAMENLPNRLVDVLRSPALSVLGIMDADSRIDIDRLHDAAYEAMHDTLDISIPVVGRFIFSRSDIDKLCDMIRRA